jgi:glycogen debranching enzyme
VELNALWYNALRAMVEFTAARDPALAVSLPCPLLDREHAAALLEVVGRRLLVTCGLRTLDPADPAYAGRYEGPPARRDEAYHQGTAWAWLAGPFAGARYRVTGDSEAARAVLEPFVAPLADAGLGTISEVFDGDAPHAPRGCIAQAWSVAEVPRVWRLISEVEP